MNKTVILLTACINPDGMSFTNLNNPEERKKQYVEALAFYLNHTILPIVFVENSNTDISNLFEEQLTKGRLEILIFEGNKEKTKGKGYGEAEIIDYALNNSKIIKDSYVLIKITGRLIVENVEKLVLARVILGLNKAVQCSINSKFSFADSRVIMVPVSFMKRFLSRKSQINDSKDVFFEDVLLKLIKEESPFYYFPFINEPQILGSSGSTGQLYMPSHPSFSQQLAYMKFQLWLVCNYPDYSLHRLNFLKVCLFRVSYLMIRLYCKVSGC